MELLGRRKHEREWGTALRRWQAGNPAWCLVSLSAFQGRSRWWWLLCCCGWKGTRWTEKRLPDLPPTPKGGPGGSGQGRQKGPTPPTRTRTNDHSHSRTRKHGRWGMGAVPLGIQHAPHAMGLQLTNPQGCAAVCASTTSRTTSKSDRWLGLIMGCHLPSWFMAFAWFHWALASSPSWLCRGIPHTVHCPFPMVAPWRSRKWQSGK